MSIVFLLFFLESRGDAPASHANFLIFHHIYKAGGTSIHSSIGQAGGFTRVKPGDPVYNKVEAAGRLAAGQAYWIYSRGGTKDTTAMKGAGRRVPVTEDSFTGETKIFHIMNVREPCSYYKSLWSYQHIEKAAQRHKKNIDSCLGNHTSEVYVSRPLNTAEKLGTTPDDKARFEKFVRYISGPTVNMESFRIWLSLNKLPQHPLGSGCISRDLSLDKAVARDLEQFSLGDVNCWIRTENLKGDLFTCLKRFGRLTNDTKLGRNMSVSRKMQRALLQNPNHFSSNDCSAMYSPGLARFVQEKDRVIFKNFGYTCCGSSSLVLPQ